MSAGALSEGSSAPAAGGRTVFVPAAIGMLLAALALRIAGASGVLWLDEVWSLKLVVLARQLGVLWTLTVDNNHFLNTLYLALVGFDAPVLVQRGLSIALGTATVAAVGAAMRRSGRPGMLAGMALAAFAYPLVNYGSEARGYAGLILMTVLGVILDERAQEEPRRSTAVLLGVVGVLGLLFQPVMLLSLAILGLWSAWRFWRASHSLRQTERRLVRLFLPMVALALPFIVLVAIALTEAGGYQMGDRRPFSAANFVAGYGGLMSALLGIPESVPAWIGGLLAVALLAAYGALFRRQPGARTSLYVIALLVVPVLVFCLRPPNAGFPRYYLSVGTIFVLLLADLFAACWRAGPRPRLLASLAALAVAVGTATQLGLFFHYARGDPAALLRIATANGPATVTSNFENRDQVMVEYVAARFGVPAGFVAWADLCAARPGWLLTSDPEDLGDPLVVTRPDCTLRFRRAAAEPHWGLSGTAWTLYRAENAK